MEQGLTKNQREQIWRNSERIAQQAFSLGNWIHCLENYLPEDFQAGKRFIVTKEMLLKALKEAHSTICDNNRANMNITSYNS